MSTNFFDVPICLVDDDVQRLYTHWCHIPDIVYMNIFGLLFISLDVIRIKTFDIDYIVKKVVFTTLDIDLFYTIHLYTNIIISNGIVTPFPYNFERQ